MTRLVSRRLLIFSCLVWTSSAAAEEVRWRSDYLAARKDAASTGRVLVLNFGSENCMWCTRLESDTFRDKTVAGLMNRHCVALKIDGQREAALADALRVQSYPTIVLAGPDGRIVGFQEGYVDAARFGELLRRAVDAVSKASAKAEPAAAVPDGRARQARELLTQARDDYRGQQYARCLDACEVLAATYANLPEGAEATRLAETVAGDPQALQLACDQTGEKLGAMQIVLAETWLKKGQSQQAMLCLERVMRMFPGTRQADVARAQLAQINGKAAASAGSR
jgi:thioredoxin-related protein